MDVPPRRINEIVLGKRGITADTAVRMALALGTSERFWLGLQADYDLAETHRELGDLSGKIERLAATGRATGWADQNKERQRVQRLRYPQPSPCKLSKMTA